jgi:hypothetical protein
MCVHAQAQAAGIQEWHARAPNSCFRLFPLFVVGFLAPLLGPFLHAMVRVRACACGIPLACRMCSMSLPISRWLQRFMAGNTTYYLARYLGTLATYRDFFRALFVDAAAMPKPLAVTQTQTQQRTRTRTQRKQVQTHARATSPPPAPAAGAAAAAAAAGSSAT